jgi:CelD/BcsL family acetyltransferase involved in cellulose biosynthesis
MFAVARPSRAPAGLEVEALGSLAGLEAVRGEWTELWARTPGATPFEHPAWVLPWARTHAPDRTSAVAVRSGGALVGFAPVFSWRGSLFLAATGPSDRGDALIAPEGEAVAPALLEAIAGEADAAGCGVIDLKQLPPGSALLSAPAPSGWRSRVEEGDPCPVAPLFGPEGLGAMPGKWRRKLGYTRRKAAELGGYAIETPCERTLPVLRQALERLHAERWSARGETGVLGGELQGALMREATPELLRAGLLRLYALRHRGRIAGVVMAMRAHATLYFYACGFDPAAGELGAGTLLIGHAISTEAADGAVAADFLRGREAYKYHWGAQDTPTLRRVLERA